MEEKELLDQIVNGQVENSENQDQANEVIPERLKIKKTNALTGEEVAYSDDLAAKWYVLHTFSGYENVAKENLETVIEKFNLQDRIFDVVIPMEDVVEEKNGKKVLVQRKAMPCYILVKMKYADDLWHNVTRTRGITGFVGPKGRPLALNEEEVMKLRLEKIKVETDLTINDKIEVIDGPLNGMVGQVVAVNPEANLLTVNVEMFGRETSVDLQFNQVRKIN